MQQHTQAAASFIITVFLMKINWYFHFSYNNRIVFMVTTYDKIVRLCHKKVIYPQNTIKTNMKEKMFMRDYATPDAYEKFLRENIGLIRKVLNPYRGLDEYDDLFQEACLGVFKALLTYNSSRGTKLTSYVFICAQNQVRMYLRTNNAKCRAGETVSLETWDGNIENQNRLLESILIAIQ